MCCQQCCIPNGSPGAGLMGNYHPSDWRCGFLSGCRSSSCSIPGLSGHLMSLLPLAASAQCTLRLETMGSLEEAVLPTHAFFLFIRSQISLNSCCKSCYLVQCEPNVTVKYFCRGTWIENYTDLEVFYPLSLVYLQSPLLKFCLEYICSSREGAEGKVWQFNSPLVFLVQF